jgi:DNA-binding transcriptional regulator YdaS (Cro superfamily)
MKTSAAVALFKTKSNLAKKLGITHSSVSQWGEDVPELRAYQIERLTLGTLKVNPVIVVDNPKSVNAT